MNIHLLICVIAWIQQAGDSAGGTMPWIEMRAGGFVESAALRRFEPRGFNYDHDEQGRLIEDYWEREWPKVEEDFGEMKELGANVVRIHLQFGRFCPESGRVDERQLRRLRDLLALAERQRMYLDVTGLGCYHKADVPEWYDALDEAARWDAQAFFWSALAEVCAGSPALFCYDLMNEPVVPGGKRADRDWLGPPFAGKHFVQFITLDQAGRPRHEVAREWTRRMVQAIRKHDPRHLITVGMVDWSLDRPALTSGFVPERIAPELDFLAVHIYPERGKVDEALRTLAGFHAVGKPVLIEETFPLKCSADELAEFLTKSREHAIGWIGFYWGKTPAELKAGGTIADAITFQWLKLFRQGW